MSEDISKPELPLTPPQARPVSLGSYARPQRGMMAADVIALSLTAIWLVGVVVYFMVMRPPAEESTQAGYVLSVLAIFLPVVLIWIGATVVKTSRIMREESARLQDALDAMRSAYLAQNQSQPSGVKPAVEQKLDEIVARQKQTEHAFATFATSRQSQVPAPRTEQPALVQPGLPEGDSQPALALGTPPDSLAPALSVDDFIGALNFPENENDAKGFNQLRRALADPNSAKLVRASQDVLTLLSQDGIYMDDLVPERSRPELWRKFAAGQRGAEISAIGGIHDRSGLALTAGRMRADPVFRDTMHHFLRQFDRTFAKFAEGASDQDITRLSETRTARAFMLLGRAAGTFD